MYWRVVRPAFERAIVWMARGKRRLLTRTVFIGVTGSAGKTTTKELIAAVLSARQRVRMTSGTYNAPYDAARTVLATRRHDAFCIVEMSATRAGALDEHVALTRPSISVITNVGTDHLSAFGSSDAIALEKGK